MDPVHLIPKQRIRRELRSRYPRLDEQTLLNAVWHESMWVRGCRHHHNELDVSRKLRIPASEIPLKTRVVARLFGVEWSLDLDYH